MTPTKIHLTFRTDASGDVLIDKASPEPFVGSEEFVRAYVRAVCGDCIQLGGCAYEFGAKASDPACTGFREPLRVKPAPSEKGVG